MNKRLKELYTQVCMEQKLPFTVEHNSAVMLDAFANKFAELIVRECLNAVCDPRTTYLESITDASAMYTARERIRKHFGVES